MKKVTRNIWITLTLIVLAIFSSYLYRVLDFKESLKAEIDNYPGHFLSDYFVNPGHCNEDCSSFDLGAMVLDDNLVYYTDYSKYKSLVGGGEKSYYPINTAFITLAHHVRYLAFSTQEDLELFKSNAEWFLENQNEKGCWTSNLRLSYGQDKVLSGNWCSALAQGLVLSVLVRYAELGNRIDDQILLALDALNDPQTKIKTTVSDFPFFEEYPLGENSFHVLNGYMFTLIGIHEICESKSVRDNVRSSACNIFDTHIKTLENIVNLYDLGFWSKYSLNEEYTIRNHYNLASPNYHRLHIILLTKLSSLANSESLQEQSKKFYAQMFEGSFFYIISFSYILYQDLVTFYKWAFK